VDDFVAVGSPRFNRAPQASTGQRQVLSSQVIENKLLLQLLFNRLGHIGPPVDTLWCFTFCFNNLQKQLVEPS
jgi:hypothetical protein